MKFRPCIDIHNGKVKQIVGGSLRDVGDFASENYVSGEDSSFYASLFKQDGIEGAHVIMLNSRDSEYYQSTKDMALKALAEYPGKLQIGGGITADNAAEFIEAGAGHVIVTSYIFENGKLSYERLNRLVSAVGKEHIVLDLSCRKKDNRFFVVVDRWQTFTDVCISTELLDELSEYCDEYLIHGVDAEGKRSGTDPELIALLSGSDRTITYAGGIASMEDIENIRKISGGRMNITIGSALDLYGGKLPYKELVKLK